MKYENTKKTMFNLNKPFSVIVISISSMIIITAISRGRTRSRIYKSFFKSFSIYFINSIILLATKGFVVINAQHAKEKSNYLCKFTSLSLRLLSRRSRENERHLQQLIWRRLSTNHQKGWHSKIARICERKLGISGIIHVHHK